MPRVQRPFPPHPAAALQVGAVHSTRLGEDDSKTLKQLNFQVRCCGGAWCVRAALCVCCSVCVLLLLLNGG